MLGLQVALTITLVSLIKQPVRALLAPHLPHFALLGIEYDMYGFGLDNNGNYLPMTVRKILGT